MTDEAFAALDPKALDAVLTAPAPDGTGAIRQSLRAQSEEDARALVAAVVAVYLANVRKDDDKPDFVDHLLAFPGPLEVERDQTPLRGIDL